LGFFTSQGELESRSAGSVCSDKEETEIGNSIQGRRGLEDHSQANIDTCPRFSTLRMRRTGAGEIYDLFAFEIALRSVAQS
jgi:hypothetical protein